MAPLSAAACTASLGPEIRASPRAGAFVATTLRAFLPGNVLDVGSGRSSEGLKASLGNAYHALDLASSYQFRRPAANTTPDAVADLERGELLFDDKAFDTVICTDALEHIDNIYRVHDELFRVSRRYVIISLPNNWPNLLGSFLIGRNTTRRAGYGLTPQPKPHGQRHKYFFNFEKACEFLGGRVPAGFRICHFDQRFEHGNDGFLCFLRPVSLLFRGMQTGRPFAKTREQYGPAKCYLLAALAVLDEALAASMIVNLLLAVVATGLYAAFHYCGTGTKCIRPSSRCVTPGPRASHCEPRGSSPSRQP